MAFLTIVVGFSFTVCHQANHDVPGELDLRASQSGRRVHRVVLHRPRQPGRGARRHRRLPLLRLAENVHLVALRVTLFVSTTH